MTGSANIHDVWIRELALERKAYGDRLLALRFHDHLLRRFGSLEILKLTPGSKIDSFVRHEADEVWVLIEGSVECTFLDVREASPTNQVVLVRQVTQASQIFVPFGVAFAVQAGDAGAALLRVATHEPDPDQPESLFSEEGFLED